MIYIPLTPEQQQFVIWYLQYGIQIHALIGLYQILGLTVASMLNAHWQGLTQPENDWSAWPK